MKYFLILTFTLIFISCKGQDYKVEKKLFECLVSSSKTIGIDLKKELIDFENHLIETGILNDNSGNSYYQIYKHIEKEGDINFSFNYSLLDTIRLHSDSTGIIDFQKDCTKNFEKIMSSNDYKKSKLHILKLTMDSIQRKGDIDISSIAKTITNVLSPRDFEQDYYKMTLMLTLITTQDVDTGLPRRLPPAPENNESPFIKKRNLVHIHMTNETDSLFFNSHKLSINDLPLITKEYILSDKSDTLKPELKLINIDNIGDCYQSQTIISVENDRDTKYDTYIKVQSQLLKAYELARNDVSIKYFNKKYDELNDSEKEIIKKLIPLRISEAEPK